MSRRAAKALPRQRLIYEGPVGLCPCCAASTEIRLASTLGVPPLKVWVVPRRVLEFVYREVALRIKDKAGRYYVTDPSIYDTNVRTKLFFVDGADGIAGPFGQIGLKVFLGASLGAIKAESIQVYVVSTMHRSLCVIKRSPFAKSSDDAEYLDETSDLF